MKTSADQRPRTVTASDVARRAGVSRSAVSRAFTPEASIHPRTREQVLAVARELGYRPNALARSLVKSKQGPSSGLIAVVMGEFDNPFQPHFFSQLTQALQAQGRVAMLVMPDAQGSLDDALERLIAYQVEGAIIAAGSLSPEATNAFLALGTPAVLLGREDPRGRVSAILTDNRAVGERAADYLLRQQRKAPAFIGGRADGQASHERQQGFIETLSRTGFNTVPCLSNPDYSYASGYRAAQQLLRDHPDTDALFCACDALALGAMDALRAAGKTSPEQFSLIGCDDVPQAAWPGYQLTTLAQPVQQLVTQALDHLITSIASQRTDSPEVLRLTPEFVQRQS
ncbi:hypothetical protein BGP77_12235 [Saccharospirillum sp. MSK14-1]|uniref:LacI family DNA-binding transcriptional regulator n=1 Tax=Saccharospirillum sp. MSK14-1 TaxID=1897632 RepID=UPI000D3714CD|nr:LacI family DNA-binding transcriptional regulator [Saccharospirillum sp. MSK14-1]PTY38470.1 hypothetical protein BGP77_12235 [Saccharospirillum sp. MSK14-1]